MSDVILGREVQLGYADETTIGTRGANVISGIPNLNNSIPVPGQEIIQEQKGTGLTVPSDVEHKAGVRNPAQTIESTLFAPLAGHLAAALTQNVTESGAGPYDQEVTPNPTVGKAIYYGESNVRGISVVGLTGQTGSRNVAGLGGLTRQIDFTFGEAGLARISAQMLFHAYDDADDGSAGTGSFDLPDPATELLVHDFKYALDTAALYADEVSVSLIAEYVVKRYGGMNDTLPYKFILNGFRVEGRFTRPVLTAVDTLTRDYINDGGENVEAGSDFYNNMSLVIHPAALAYNAALDAEGQLRIECNIVLDDAPLNFDDELQEEVTFHGVQDQDGNDLFKINQATATAQTWAA